MSDKSRADSSSIDATTTICDEKINSRSNSEEGLNSNEENNESMENNSDGASVKQDELVANNSLGSEALNSTDNVAIDQTAPNDVKCELSNGQTTVLNGSASAVDTNTNKFASEENLYQELIINKHLSELNKSREEYEKTTRLLVERAQEKFPDYSKHKVVKYIKSTMNEFSIKYNSNSIDYLIKQDKFKSKAKTDMVNSASQRSDESANDNNGRDSNTPVTSQQQQQQQQPDSNYLPPSSASPSPSPLKNQLKTSTSSSSLSNKNVSFTTSSSSSSMEQQPQRLNSNSPKLAYNSIPSPSSVSSSTSNNNNKHSSSQSDSLKNSKKFKSNVGAGALSSSPSPSLSKSSDTSKMNDSQKSPHGLNAMSFFGNNPAAAAAFEAAAKFNPFAAGLSSSSGGIPGLPSSASSTNPLASYLAGMTPTPGSGATGPSGTAPFLDPDFLRFANPLFRFPDFNPAAATAGNPYLNSLNHLFRSNLAAAAAFGGQLPFGAPPSVSSSSTSASSSSSSSSSSSNPSSFMPPSSTLSMQPSSSSSFSPASSSFTSSILNQSKSGSSFNPPVSSSSSSSSYDHKPNDSFGYLNGSSSLDPTSLSSPLLSSSSSSSSSSKLQQQPNKSTLNNSSGSQQSKQSNLTNASSKSANNKPTTTSVTSNGDSYANKSHSNNNANSQNQLSSLSLFNSSIKFKLNGKFSKLTHTELQSMKNLITSYRESAAFLCRSADELEGILSECSSSTNTGSNNPTTPNSHHSSLMNHHSSHHASHHHHPHHHLE